MKVILSDRAYCAILAETLEHRNTETGGLFLGICRDDICYIVEAIDPGPNSRFEVAYFEYDQKYTQHLINKIAGLYKSKLGLVGLWHRHPGSFDIFSGTDDGTNAKYAALHEFGAVSALVNLDPEFRLTIYHVSKKCTYEKVDYETGNALIPAEILAYQDVETYLSQMEKRGK
ncbi:MAG: Mov34/MPN/PAD-1 family protein [Lachnospiraceae bacterium]|nr:Mov34/MPN/PAD-1 family protein [Lachnospiraceae bacterium]MDD3616811.1 Mov34/MPN/PAD-1 family protein [Lachnospiraceae bacterium]